MSFSPSNFGRYVSQTEQSMDESNGINEWTQKTPPASTSTVNDVPSFLPTSTTISPPIIPTNIPQKLIIPTPVIKDEVEPLPFPQHGPGPIQRPNKFTTSPIQSAIPSYLTNSIQSPGTPDVIDQINRFLDQNNPSSIPSTPSVNNSTMPLNDLSSPAMPWTTFSSAEWPSKYDSPWSLGNLQSPTVSLNAPVQNPFTLISAINEQQRQATREDASVWSPVLGNTTPRLIPTSLRTQRATTWNDLFQSTVPSATDSPRTTNSPWLKGWPVPDPSSVDMPSANGRDTETNNTFWNLNALANEAVIPTTMPTTSTANATAWWPNSSSDENNNTNQSNHINEDTTNNRDRSRWEFAR